MNEELIKLLQEQNDILKTMHHELREIKVRLSEIQR